jgi:hypothetical protein
VLSAGGESLLIHGQIVDAIERLVGLLQGDEGRDTKGDLVEGLVKDPATVRAGIVGVSTEEEGPTVAARPQLEKADEEDDVIEV